MVFDCVRNVGFQSIIECVIAAHRTLQLGKLAHHIGHKVSFCQLRGLICLLCQHIAAHLLSNRFRNRTHTLYALALGTQLVVIHNLGKPINARRQCLFAILIKEKFGIRQTRAHHALVATNHRTGVSRADVADHQEPVRQLARTIEQRKVLLVRLHRENQALLRHIEKLLLELADEHIRPLDQRRHFVQQGIVINGFATSAYFCGSRS